MNKSCNVITLSHKSCLELTFRNLIILEEKHNSLKRSLDRTVSGEFFCYLDCPQCKAAWKVVITDEPIKVQRIVYLHSGRSNELSFLGFCMSLFHSVCDGLLWE